MNIITGKTLRNQDKEFVDLVTNAKTGDVYLLDSRFLVNGVVASYFLVSHAEEITTRFGNRDRILRGWKCSESNNELKKIDTCSVWCSNLDNTENLIEKFTLYQST